MLGYRIAKMAKTHNLLYVSNTLVKSLLFHSHYALLFSIPICTTPKMITAMPIANSWPPSFCPFQRTTIPKGVNKWVPTAPIISKPVKVLAILFVVGRSIAIASTSSMHPRRNRPHCSTPRVEKIWTACSWLPNLKYRDCNKMMATRSRIVNEILCFMRSKVLMNNFSPVFFSTFF